MSLNISHFQPKVAVFYDWLNQWGGAEKVLLDILTIYPDAHLFTLVHDPAKTHWLPKTVKVTQSFISKLPNAKNNPIYYTFLYPIALEQFDFSRYDIIISTTSTVGHCLLTPPSALYICYFHNINRYLYQTPSNYYFLKPLLYIYRKIDRILAQRPDSFLTNSCTVQKRIKENYHLPSDIIYPSVDMEIFSYDPEVNKSDYYLVVSRLVPHKKIDVAINACHRLNKKLLIIGEGRQSKQLHALIRKLNNPGIKMQGSVSQKELINYYRQAKALICPQLEDFGISPLESMACGTPVIGYNRGGLTETVIHQKTGFLFDQQSVDSLIQAISHFEKLQLNPLDCVNQASKFSRRHFMLNFSQRVQSLWQTHQKIQTDT